MPHSEFSTNGNGLPRNGHSNGRSEQRAFGSPAPGFNSNTHRQTRSSVTFESDTYDEFAKILDNLHFNMYKDIFDVVREYGRVASTKYVFRNYDLVLQLIVLGH